MTELNKRPVKMSMEREGYDHWATMTLKDKLHATLEANTLKDYTSRWISRAGVLIFWYAAITVYYCFISHFVPEYCVNSQDTIKYYCKIGGTLLLIETCANWFCVFFYSSANRKSSDNKLDEDLVLKRNGSLPHHVSNIATKETLNAKIWEDENSDRTGLVWSNCDKCDLPKPPRAHHCTICNVCILKRDHHCFFTNSCIGYYNQRYFVMLNFYIAVSTIVGLIIDWKYLSLFVDPAIGWQAYFLPNTLYYWWYDQLPIQCLIMISHLYIYIWCIPLASGFFITQISAIYMGKTTHELYKQEKIKCFSKYYVNFKDVFGDCWMLNFIFPAVLVYRQEGDGKHWKYIKKY